MDFLERVLKLMTGNPTERKYCDLNSIVNLEFEDVMVCPDALSKVNGTEPEIVYIVYKGKPVASAYSDKFVMADDYLIYFSNEEDQKKLFALFETIESYYTTY